MPGMLIQQGAVVMCAHGAPAMPSVPNPSVTLEGMPSSLLSAPWIVTGCPAAAAMMPPCVSATWAVGTTRVTSFGQPLLVQSGVSICAPSGLPLLPVMTQLRVSAM
ncbi:hypothetical protein [Paraburkholderia sp. MM5384-R2]|uniref:hypothetical protein n=1 Tax=Paraburkholderia sp. MM5384-R2 TaxID=2723097 RepID=UPI00161DB576|nr:hypothetical protein [Paraburkholderia sp. MM5384-R2]MBB5503108.1 hypothetical protein [Paraburkholderia sp. MM5384-R2]